MGAARLPASCDVGRLQVLVDIFEAAFATETGLLDTPERCRRIGQRWAMRRSVRLDEFVRANVLVLPATSQPRQFLDAALARSTTSRYARTR